MPFIQKSYFAYLIFMMAFACHVRSQGYDRVWISGYDFWSSGDTAFGGTYIDFTKEPPIIYYDPNHLMNFWGTATTISNNNGQLLFYTNGMTIHNSNHSIVPGGDTIGFGPYWTESLTGGQIGGMNLIQGAFILPDPSNESNKYYLIHTKADIQDPVLFEMSDIMFTRISVDNDEPFVIVKDKIIVHDTLMYGELAVCRHANGRDWWIVIGRKYDNRYYSILISAGGIVVDSLQTVGSKIRRGVGQSGFAQGGAIYYRFEGEDFGDEGATINIYDFDRCTGVLSNHRWWHHPLFSFGGATASSSGRYLYTTDALKIYQWDIDQPDIKSTQKLVAVYDGFVEPGGFETYFGFMNLAPDGRIYIIPPSASSRIMHTIERPNEQGDSCKVIQHKISLPTWNLRTLPLIPDFRLGPLDESTCDTLGMDNNPIASFRSKINEIDKFTCQFIDLSYHNPEMWLWDFGDGTYSDVPEPIHIYGQTGVYNVCLEVSNINGSNTFCQEVLIEKSNSLNEIHNNLLVTVTPNPISNCIKIIPNSPGIFNIRLYGIEGKALMNNKLSCPCTILSDFLEPGLYILFISQGANIKIEKLVKL